VPIPDEIRAAIIQDGKEGRLSQEEIAAKRLGDKKKVGTISKILKKAGVSTKGRGRPKAKSFSANLSTKKSASKKPIKLESFESKNRLDLLDEALSYLKASLPEVYSPKGFSEWTSAVERLLNQRRIEAPAAPLEPEDDGFMMALETKTPEVWKDAPDIPVQMDSSEHSPMADLNLVGDGLTDQEPKRDNS